MTKQAEQLRVTQSREDAGLPGNDYSVVGVVMEGSFGIRQFQMPLSFRGV